ncbi:MAG: hydrogenase, partial [Planctomycetota bacterium]
MAAADPTVFDDTPFIGPARAPLVTGEKSLRWITDRVTGLALRDTPWQWTVAFIVSSMFATLLVGNIFWLFYRGVGVWGNNTPVAWGWPIVNF